MAGGGERLIEPMDADLSRIASQHREEAAVRDWMLLMEVHREYRALLEVETEKISNVPELETEKISLSGYSHEEILSRIYAPPSQICHIVRDLLDTDLAEQLDQYATEVDSCYHNLLACGISIVKRYGDTDKYLKQFTAKYIKNCRRHVESCVQRVGDALNGLVSKWLTLISIEEAFFGGKGGWLFGGGDCSGASRLVR